MYKDKHNIITGAAKSHDLLYLSIRNSEIDKEGVSHSLLGAYYQGERHYVSDTPWDTVAMSVVHKPVEKMIIMSPNGDVLTHVNGIVEMEHIHNVDISLKGLAEISGYAYACGMKRQVFKRISDNTWMSMSAPVPEKRSGVIGFEAISGFDENDIYAVGWQGEIWKYNGLEWIQKVSPTNQILTSVACADDGMVYICGRKGMLIKGKDDQWEILSSNDNNDDFWDVHYFKGKVYVSSLSAIYEVVDDGLKMLRLEDVPGTCMHLTSADGIMWSIGIQDLLSFDGEQWQRIE